MLFASLRLALRDVLSPPFRAVLWKSLGLTLAVLAGLWFAVRWLFETVAIPFFARWIPAMPAWVESAETFAGVAAGIALALLLAFLIGPVSAIVAGFFLDDAAEVVERRDYPQVPVGRALPFLQALALSVKFFGVVILGNLLAFALLLVPGVNFVAFFAVNGYLLGREYFEFAALRYRSEHDAKTLRARHGTTVFLAGLVLAVVLAIPVVNLLTPLLAASLMVHLHQRISAREGGLPIAPPRAAPRLA